MDLFRLKKRRLIKLIVLMLLLLITGGVGYRLLLDISWLNAFYMTVITISTVGYSEVAPMNDMAKIFSMCLIIFSLGSVGYIVSSVVTLFFEGKIQEAWRLRKMIDTIERLENHYIVCGFGETGYYIVQDLIHRNKNFVVIEADKEKVEAIAAMKIPVICGDSTNEEILISANIKKAIGLAATLSNDADNLFAVMTARDLNANLQIVSRTIDPHSHNKLIKAGANNTVSPNEIGGKRIAAMLLRPAVISFLDAITHAGDVVLDLENVNITENSPLCGQTLATARLPEKTGLIILAIRHEESGVIRHNPSSSEIMKAGDTLIVLGREDQINTLRELANSL